MKIKRTMFSILLGVVSLSTISLSLTSCSGVSDDIIKNMVDIGDSSLMAKAGDDASITLKEEIETALSDKGATDKFKASVVNSVLWKWFNKCADNGNNDFKSKRDDINKDVDKQWNDLITKMKNNHKGDWQYYLQNDKTDGLNQFGGSKDTWYQAKKEDAVRTYMVDKIRATNYFGVPNIPSTWDKVKTFANNSLDELTAPLDLTDQTATGIDENVSIVSNVDTNGDNYLGADHLYNGSDVDYNHLLNPDWWPTINFYANSANSYTSGSDYTRLDKTFALIERVAFKQYTDTNLPMSTSMVLWKTGGGTDDAGALKDIYNATDINAAGNDLSKTSAAFPYFTNKSKGGETSTNQQWADFASLISAADSNNLLLNGGGDTNLKLNNIPYNGGQYTQDSSDVFLLTRGKDASTPTFGYTLYDLYDHLRWSTTDDLDMPDSSDLYGYDATDGQDIMQNFLFCDQSVTPTGTGYGHVQKLPTSYSGYKNIIDLNNLYGTGTDDGCKLFNPDSKTTSYYNDKAQYMVGAVHYTGSIGDASPYILTFMSMTGDNAASGVHLEGIDGAGYLSQSPTTMNSTSSLWRPGDAWRQTRENQILKFRTIYENYASNPTSGKGIALVDGKPGEKLAGKLLTDYMNDDAKLNDSILEAIKVWHDNFGQYDLFGLGKSTDFDNDSSNKEVWNDKLNNLVKSFWNLNLFNSVIAQYSTDNKNIYSRNADQVKADLYGTKYDNGKYIRTGKLDIFTNGLSTPLSLIPISGNVSSTLPTSYDTGYFTHYKLTINTVNTILGSTLPTTASLVQQIKDNYSIWQESLSPSDTANMYSQALKDNKGKQKKDSKAYQYAYSENIESYNKYVNDMLWTFGGSKSFDNLIKDKIYAKYLDNHQLTINCDEAITSLYYTSQLITGGDKNTLGYYANAKANNNPLDFTDYQSVLNSAWINSNFLNSDQGSIGYTDKTLNYLKLKASLAYLQKDNNKNFISWLQNRVTSDKQKMAYIMWCAKNVSDSECGTNATFGNDSATANTIYGWKDNYAGLVDNIYQDTNVSYDSSSKTFTSFDQYYQFAPMLGQAFDGMGYLGLQTSSSNANIPSNVQKALFDSNNKYYGLVNGGSDITGSLYGYVTDDTDGRNNLLSEVDKAQGSTALINLATYINNQTSNLGSTLNLMTNSDYYDKPDEQRTILKDAINHKNASNAYDTIPESCFMCFNNRNQDSTKKTLELYNQNAGSKLFYDDEKKLNGPATRATVIQLNYRDVSSYDNLEAAVGSDLIPYLLVQAAMDSNIQNNAEMDVISSLSNGLIVYDRRYNDDLGPMWLKGNYKTTN